MITMFEPYIDFTRRHIPREVLGNTRSWIFCAWHGRRYTNKGEEDKQDRNFRRCRDQDCPLRDSEAQHENQKDYHPRCKLTRLASC